MPKAISQTRTVKSCCRDQNVWNVDVFTNLPNAQSGNLTSLGYLAAGVLDVKDSIEFLTSYKTLRCLLFISVHTWYELAITSEYMLHCGKSEIIELLLLTYYLERLW